MQLKITLNKKLENLQNIGGDDFDVSATLKREGNNQVAEIRTTVNGVLYKAVVASQDLYASIDKDIEVLEGQIRKNKTKNDKQNMTDSIRLQNVKSSRGC